MNFKVSLSLPKLVRLKVGVRLGLEDGAKLDVRVKLRGGRAWKWTAMADPGRKKLKNGNGAHEPPLLRDADEDGVRQ